jgi:hypothetical protein
MIEAASIMLLLFFEEAKVLMGATKFFCKRRKMSFLYFPCERYLGGRRLRARPAGRGRPRGRAGAERAFPRGIRWLAPSLHARHGRTGTVVVFCCCLPLSPAHRGHL